MLIPRPPGSVPVVEVPLKQTQRGRCERPGLFRLAVPLSWFAPDYGYTFTESLILAQDERWRRA